MKNLISGLIVKPSTREDRALLNDFFNNSDYYAEYDSEWDCFMMPESEDTIDSLEMELTELFTARNISARFETNII